MEFAANGVAVELNRTRGAIGVVCNWVVVELPLSAVTTAATSRITAIRSPARPKIRWRLAGTRSIIGIDR